jgi:rhamnose transport system permease protein
MLNVAGIVMSMIVGMLLIVAMVLPRWLRRRPSAPAAPSAPTAARAA